MSLTFVRKSLVNQILSTRIWESQRDSSTQQKKTAIDHLGMTPAQVEKYSSSTKDNEGGGK
jgi:hypothetical protein